MSPTSRPNQGGFTLIELLVVISVIAILAALVAPMVFRNVGDAKRSAAASQLQIFELALDGYRLDNNYYPSTSQGLRALIQAPAGDPRPVQWRGPYLKRAVPTDPWGHDYLYTSPVDGAPDGYQVKTLGRDGASGGTGEDEDLVVGGVIR